MKTDGKVSSSIEKHLATITFSHPKGNSLPGYLLKDLATQINALAENEDINVIILSSDGDKAFCGGASFDELLAIKDFESGRIFFMGFVDVFIAVKNCPKFIIARVQGKVVGGGVGLVAAADYAIASENASVRLSELALGIGPFVIGPVIERKIGRASFVSMTINHDWKDASWALEKGLYDELCKDEIELNEKVKELAAKLERSNPEAVKELKKIFWEGTEDWEKILKERAETSGRLVLSEYTSKFIHSFKNNKS